MSRSNTPSCLSTLTAYSADSTDDEEELDIVNLNKEDKDSKEEGARGDGKVTLLVVPSMSREPSPSPSPNPSGGGLVKSLVSGYTHEEEDEENFEYQRDPEEDEEEEGGQQGEGIDKENNEEDKKMKDVGDIGEEDEDPLTKKRRKLNSLLPEPEGECDPQLQRKFAKMLELKKKGRKANQYIQGMKEFRNPSIYEKLILLCDIDENGTNFPDPPKFEASSYYDELDKAQRSLMEKRYKDKERKAKEVATSMVKVDYINKASVPVPPPGLAVPKPPQQPSTYIKAFGNLAFKN